MWGWNPETVSAITATLAALSAVVAGYLAWRVYRLERERERRASERLKRHQAELISAWTVVKRGADDRSSVELRVQNLGSAPVYEVTLGVQLGTVCSYAAKKRVVPPTGHESVAVELTEKGLERWRRWATGPVRSLPPYAEFTFCDAAGAWWFRDTRGALVEIQENQKYLYNEDRIRPLTNP